MNEFANDANNCTLTSLATIFEYWQKHSGACPALPNTYLEMYRAIRKVAIDNNYYNSSGTKYWVFEDLANKVFKKFNYMNSKCNNDYILTWDTVKTEIAHGRPFCFNIANYGGYSDHTVSVYAYSAYKRGSEEKRFLKIIDGYNKSDKYIDFSAFSGLGSFTKIIAY